MRRPVGVILSCIILGFAALILLMMAGSSLLSLAVLSHMPVQPGQPTPDPAALAKMMHALMIVSALFYALLAAWAVATLIGLARMRTWARYSVMVIGAGLAFMGLCGVMFALAMPTLMASAPMPQGQNPAFLRIGMIFMGVFFFALASIGVWWLVYFALRRTREAFALAKNPQLAPALVYPPPPSPYAASTYEVASYVTAADPVAEPVSYPVHPVVVMQDVPPARPLAISIIGWLLIVGTVFTLPFVFLPLPLFVFGLILTGLPGHLTMAAFAVISGLAGIGLLRLEKIALYAAYAFYGIGIVNSGLTILPSVRERMVAYQQILMQKMSMGMPPPPGFDNQMTGLMMLPGIFIGIILCAVALVFLFINRRAFDRA